MGRLGQRIRSYGILARRLVPMLTGRSYYHRDQPSGVAFRPGHLDGYFCDLRHKADWHGIVDADGIPMNTGGDGKPMYFPITIVQKAIGHWDRWLVGGRRDRDEWQSCLHICRWLVDRQEDRGGWALPFANGPPFVTPYSAMAQGEAASILTRAYTVTDDAVLLDAATTSLRLMVRPVEMGGTARIEDGGLILQEFTTDPPNVVLNGWMFSLFGLYDYLLVVDDDRFRQALEQTVTTLAEWLPRFDAGYWSFYDEAGNIASPFYHDVHLAQLKGMLAAFPDSADVWTRWHERWGAQRRSRLKRSRAIAHKIFQKAVHPPKMVMR